MKTLLIGLMILGSLSVFAKETLENTVKNISRECNNKEMHRQLSIGKIQSCSVDLSAKAPLNKSIFCLGEIRERNVECKVSLVESKLSYECRGKRDGGLWLSDSSNVDVQYFQPTITVVGTKRQLKATRGNATVISADSSDLNVVVFHESLVTDNHFKSNASIKINLGNGSVLSNVSCYIID